MGKTIVRGRFEWDEEKSESNLKKHGFAFEEILSVFDDPYFYEIYDNKHSSLEEDRFIGIGMHLGVLVVTSIYTERKKIRLISSRVATQQEETLYYEQQKHINT